MMNDAWYFKKDVWVIIPPFFFLHANYFQIFSIIILFHFHVCCEFKIFFYFVYSTRSSQIKLFLDLSKDKINFLYRLSYYDWKNVFSILVLICKFYCDLLSFHFRVQGFYCMQAHTFVLVLCHWCSLWVIFLCLIKFHSRYRTTKYQGWQIKCISFIQHFLF